MTLQYHQRPIRKVRGGRHTGFATPYKFEATEGGWRIGFGPSGFLVAEGAGVSQAVGKKLYRDLEDAWLLRRRAVRPKRKRNR